MLVSACGYHAIAAKHVVLLGSLMIPGSFSNQQSIMWACHLILVLVYGHLIIRSLHIRGIGAVVYKVPELGNVELLKISLRSLAGEDTTPISQVILFGAVAFNAIPILRKICGFKSNGELILQNFGGGGHRNASSFMLSAKEFERWKVQAIPQWWRFEWSILLLWYEELAIILVIFKFW